MPTPQLAPINPRILVWARQDSGWALEDVARKLVIKVERMEAWESGEQRPGYPASACMEKVKNSLVAELQ